MFLSRQFRFRQSISLSHHAGFFRRYDLTIRADSQEGSKKCIIVVNDGKRDIDTTEFDWSNPNESVVRATHMVPRYWDWKGSLNSYERRQYMQDGNPLNANHTCSPLDVTLYLTVNPSEETVTVGFSDVNMEKWIVPTATQKDIIIVLVTLCLLRWFHIFP